MATSCPRALSIALLTIAASAAHADMVQGLVRFQGSTNAFSISNYSDKALPAQGSYITFDHSISKTKTLYSLFRFERLIANTRTTVPFTGKIMVVKPGDVITNERIQAGAYPSIGAQPGKIVGREFWLAIAIAPNNPGPITYNTFSWARVRFNAMGVPEMLDHVTAHQEPGVVVGEKTPCQPCVSP